VEQAMNYEITKLDRRHSWYAQFKYMIEFKKSKSFHSYYNRSAGVLEFDRSRRWFNEKFGWSQDVETRSAIIKSAPLKELPDAFNELWAYSIKYDDYRIYVKDEATINWFVLSHSKSREKE
jgi:hypothetical protein